MSSRTVRAALAATSLLATAGCFILTEAGDRQVDALALDFVFDNMSAHAQTPLDVALVTKARPAAGIDKARLLAHARIVLPKIVPGQPYPDERLRLRGVLTEFDDEILFYADSNDDNAILAPTMDSPFNGEHIWRFPVPEEREFSHKALFETFTEDEYTSGSDLVLEVDPALVGPWAPECSGGPEQTLEVKVTISPDSESAQESGYYKNYSSNDVPRKSILLEGIVDSGSAYRVQVFVNGRLLRSLRDMASTVMADLRIPFSAWYPLTSADAGARCP